MGTYLILYRRRDSRAAAHRDCLFMGGEMSYLTAEKIAKNLQDDFGAIIENAWVEKE
jgi:hypothetical protein